MSLTCSYLNLQIMVKWCEKVSYVLTALLQHCMTMILFLGSIALWIRVFSFLHFCDPSNLYLCTFSLPWHTTFIHKVSHVLFLHSYKQVTWTISVTRIWKRKPGGGYSRISKIPQNFHRCWHFREWLDQSEPIAQCDRSSSYHFDIFRVPNAAPVCQTLKATFGNLPVST